MLLFRRHLHSIFTRGWPLGVRRALTVIAACFGLAAVARIWSTRRRALGPAEEPRTSDEEEGVEGSGSPRTPRKDRHDVPCEAASAEVAAANPCGDPAEAPKGPEEVDDEDDHHRELGEEEEEDVVVEYTDALYCEYDSTWETSSGPGSRRLAAPREASRVSERRFCRFKNAARDMYNYRVNYPNKPSLNHNGHDMPNLAFYQGDRPSAPDGVYIGDFHSDEWWGNYDKLESVHTFIQWLFPLQESGVNYEAKELTKEEIKAFLDNQTAKDNLLMSYKLMLDFYGIVLSDPETGEVHRAANWEARFLNLNRNTHNNLRITRILKCLGTLGFSHYQAPLVRFFLEEILVRGNLPNIKESLLNYFLFAVLDKKQRRELLKFAYLHYEPKEEFVWCPKKIQRLWSAEAASSHTLSNQQREMRSQDGNEDAENNP